MSNFVDKQHNKFCLYCKEPILEDKPFITKHTSDGDKVFYHTDCYYLLHPPEEYKELDFGN